MDGSGVIEPFGRSGIRDSETRRERMIYLNNSMRRVCAKEPAVNR